MQTSPIGDEKAATAQDVVLKILTPITPPHTKRNIETFNDTDVENLLLKAALVHKVAPYAIGPLGNGVTVSYSVTPSVIWNVDLQLLAKLVIVVPVGSKWNRTVGAGESYVDMYKDDGHTELLRRFTVPGVDRDVLEKEVDEIVPVPKLIAHMLLQVSLPNVYLAVAIGLHDRVAANKGEWTCAVMDVVTTVVANKILELKRKLDVPRPQDPVFALNRPEPVIDVPGYQSYPAGHAAVMGALFVVLMAITKASAAQAAKFEKLPRLIYEYRRSAGLHTASDNQAGWDLGVSLGATLLAAEGLDEYDQWTTILVNAKSEW